VTLTIGDLVTVVGQVGEYFDYTQVDWQLGSTVITDSSISVTVTPVTTAELSDIKTAEQFESVLVSISDPTVSNISPIVHESGVFAIGDDVLVDDYMYDVESDVGALTVGSSWTSVVGVLYYAWGNFKVEPRNSADFGTFSPM
jgi:predicted extracellular nuclease